MRYSYWLLAGLTVSGCGGSGDGASYGLTQRVPATTLNFPTGLANPGTYQVVDAYPLLNFAQPVMLTSAADGSDRVFVAELAGRILVFDNDETVSAVATFLDIRSLVYAGGERGLLGLAFDPDYASNGYFYVHYSETTAVPGQDNLSVIARYQVSSGDPNVADAGSELRLLTIEQPFGNHNGGMLAFGPDGHLYASIGDGGSADDPLGSGQDLTTVLGKMLRIAADGSIPADNPFVGQGGGVREEIWAYGLRNPWRFSFDRNTGDLWCGDVGQGLREEIDLIERGDNLGWDIFEGLLDHENSAGVAIESTKAPVIDYAHPIGFSVTGGYVYRGMANSALMGAYVYADFSTGRVWALVYDGMQVISNTEIANISNPAAFGEDEAGELYVCSFDGHIYRFVETSGGGAPTDFPELLSETGIFSDVPNMLAAPGVIEYDVNSALWSDGASKRRWLALPGTAQVIFDGDEAWEFPVGSVLVKHFEIETQPGTLRRLETRVFLRSVAGWDGYTYRWNAQQDDADLLPGAMPVSDVITIQDPAAPGGQFDLTWVYPSRTDCLVCHTNVAGRILGVRTRQLNGDFDYPALVDNQLRAWNHVELFTQDIGASSSYEALAALDDPNATNAARARAYLAVNCANCHQPGGPTPVAIDLRFATAPAAMNALLVVPSAGDLGLVNPFIVTPGNRQTSVLWERMRRLDTTRMPPLGTNRVDADAIDVVGQWIDDGAQ